MLFDFSKHGSVPKMDVPPPPPAIDHYMVRSGELSYPVSTDLKEIEKLLCAGQDVHWVSDGEWSMHELLLMMIEGMYGADVYISSYSFSEKPARVIASIAEQCGINLYCLIDNRIDTRSASALTILNNCAKKVKLIDTHAKVTLINYYDRHITIIGSANYTTNKRYEAGMITCSTEVFLFHKKWMRAELDGTH